MIDIQKTKKIYMSISININIFMALEIYIYLNSDIVRLSNKLPIKECSNAYPAIPNSYE